MKHLTYSTKHLTCSTKHLICSNETAHMQYKTSYLLYKVSYLQYKTSHLQYKRFRRQYKTSHTQYKASYLQYDAFVNGEFGDDVGQQQVSVVLGGRIHAALGQQAWPGKRHQATQLVPLFPAHKTKQSTLLEAALVSQTMNTIACVC